MREGEAEFVVAEAARHLFGNLKETDSARRAVHEANERDWKQKAEELRRQFGKMFPPADRQDLGWHFESGKVYLNR